MLPLPRRTLLGAHNGALLPRLASLCLVQRRVTSGRACVLDCRALSSINTYANARALNVSKEYISRILSYIYSSTSASTPTKPMQKRRRPPRKKPEVVGTNENPEPFYFDGPQLSPKQAEVVELAASGRNIFYTGSAGCGKSTVLRAMVQRLRHMGKRVEVIAPTGRAALAINGKTTWTFAGWSPNHHKRSIESLRLAAKVKKSNSRRRLRRTDVVIIDEISMVENLHLERLNQVMKAARNVRGHLAQDSEHPFGGAQVIVTGDFAQLPPVRPFQHCIKCGGETQLDERERTHTCRQCQATYNDADKWAFASKAWAECDFVYVYLDEIHRQHDPEFVSLLQKCRLGEAFTPEEVDLLMNHETNTAGAVELYSTRDEVRIVNERGFRKLGNMAYSFQCHDTFQWNKYSHPRKDERYIDGSLVSLEEHPMDRLVELKCGMPVVLLANLDMSKGLCNGSQGVVVGWTAPGGDDLGTRQFASSDPYAGVRAAEIAAFEKSVKVPVWPIVRFSNGIERPIRAECQINEHGDKEPYSLLCRTQLPLTAAWALSIHRAQGMTLEKVKVDVSKAFANGQVYVALSRATSLQGLHVVGDARGLAFGVGGDKVVGNFYKEKFGL